MAKDKQGGRSGDQGSDNSPSNTSRRENGAERADRQSTERRTGQEPDQGNKKRQ